MKQKQNLPSYNHLQDEAGLEMEQEQEVLAFFNHNNYSLSDQEMEDTGDGLIKLHHQNHHQAQRLCPPMPDLNLFHTASLLPSSSSCISFTPSTHHHRNLGFISGCVPPGDLPLMAMGNSHASSHSLLQVNLPESCGGGGGDHDTSMGSEEGGFYRDMMNGFLEFTGSDEAAGGDTKPVSSERQRRLQLNEKYDALRSLIPNPSKTDKISVVTDAIGYIKELSGTITELKLLVDKKRRSKDSSNVIDIGVQDGNLNAPLRSSWIQQKSKHMEVEVHIIKDEVTIKLHQRRRNKSDCLLVSVSKALDELRLDLQFVAGGCIGDHYSFLLSAKIGEGFTVYASAIANKVMECSNAC